MDLIIPNWPAPKNVFAAITTRSGGCSKQPWNSLNLAYHVGDDPTSVQQNWQFVSDQLALPSAPQLLDQVHGVDIFEAGVLPVVEGAGLPVADGSYSNAAGHISMVMTADCLPILLCNRAGTEVAAVHAGWRGLAAGVVSNTVNKFVSSPDELMAFLGPAISQKHFEVGSEVRQTFLDSTTNEILQNKISACFVKADTASLDSDPCVPEQTHWMADLYELSRVALNSIGVSKIYGGDLCSYGDVKQFFSYRRDGQTGRMASLIWIR